MDSLSAAAEATYIPLQFSQTGVVICDRSNWGLISVRGEDRQRYLHNQSTNDFQQLKSGRGCETVFVTSTARTIDLATAYVTDESILLLVSPCQTTSLLTWLDRFIFPLDRVELKDISADYDLFTIMGAKSNDLLAKLGVDALKQDSKYYHQLAEIGGITLRIAVGTDLAIPGYNLIVPHSAAAQIWSVITEAGATPLGQKNWESWRIQQGRPLPGKELTEDYNPLEAGLWHTISFNKGCYIGQETIARLNTYKGVKQRLWGLKLNKLVDTGTKVELEAKKVGKVTSCINSLEGIFALAYVKTTAGEADTVVQVAGEDTPLLNLPFITHKYYQPEN